jgi:tight adherence protein C
VTGPTWPADLLASLTGAALDLHAYQLRVILWPLLAGAGVTLLLLGQPLGRPRPDLAALLRELNADSHFLPDGVASSAGGGRLYASHTLETFLRPVLDDLGQSLRRVLRRLGLPDAIVPGAPSRGLEAALALAWPGLTPAQFSGQKVAVALASGSLLPVLNVADLAPWGPWPVWAWIVALLAGFFAPDLALARRLARRRADILEELPGLVDLLSLATSAGMALEQALRQVGEQTGGVVAREIQQAAREAALGRRSLVEALETMAERNGVEALSALVGRLRAAHDQGLPLAETLATQAEASRERHRLLLLEAGGRASVHMVLPVALFIFPVTFVVLLAPALVAVLSLAR